MTFDSVLLLSGGLDSMVLAYSYVHEGKKPLLLFCDTRPNGSPREVFVAKRIASGLGLYLETVNISDVLHSGKAISLAGGTLRASGPYDDWGMDGWFSNGISGFYVVLGIGSFMAQVANVDSVVAAAIKEQVFARPGAVGEFTHWTNLTKMMNPQSKPVNVVLPFSSMTKADVVKLGAELSAPMGLSWSCVTNEMTHCGECTQCESRIEAFQKAKISDPTVYLVAKQKI